MRAQRIHLPDSARRAELRGSVSILEAERALEHFSAAAAIASLPGDFMAAMDPVFGNMAFEADMRGNGVKGNLMASRPWYVRRFLGDAAFDEVVAQLDGEARAFMIDPPLTMSWCSFGTMMDIDRAILEGPMAGDREKMRHFGSEIAKHDLPTLYKILFKVGSPAFVMRRMNIAAQQYIKATSISSVTPDDHRAQLTQGGRVWPLYFCSYGAPGWFAAAAELSGGRDVSVVQTTCKHRGSDACRWDVTWR